MSTDFEKQIVQIANMVPEHVTLARETVSLSTQAVYEVNAMYGPDSETSLAYHNAPHTVGSMRRAVRLATIFYPYMQPRHQSRIFDLAMFSEATHDWKQLLTEPGANEAASTEYAIGLIEAADGILNSATFKKRIGLGHGATLVEQQEDDSLVQVNLLTGSRDPVKIITAYGDTGGIGMEGDKLMWRDATNLYDETCSIANEGPTITGLYKFIGSGEVAFMRNQLNDEHVKAVLSFYFPDSMEEVYKDLRKRFHGKIRSSFSLAKRLDEHPDLESSVGRIVRAVDQPLVGPLIGKMLRRKANHHF